MLISQYSDHKLEAGCDEAGRGCLAGPVVAAAVILDYQNDIDQLNDSKKLSKKQREILLPEIKLKAISYAIGIVSHQEIDQINILNASFLAMHRALDQLKYQPKFLLIDGNRFNPYKDINHECVVKGDAKVKAIAAASILAKTYRDELMTNYSKDYPEYGWEQNAGYPTRKHRQAIKEFGICPLHRRSFQLLPSQLEIF